ncbi:unnamed protein product, partial [Musa textilis]
TLGGVRKGIYDDHPNRDRNPDGMLPAIIHPSQASESEASLHLVKRREGHLKGKLLLRNLELQNGRLHTMLTPGGERTNALYLDFLSPTLVTVLPTVTGVSFRSGMEMEGRFRSYIRLLSTPDVLRPGMSSEGRLIRMDIINKSRLCGFIRIDVTSAIVESIGQLPRNRLCFYWEVGRIGRICFKQR